jgi:hypothetical protein
MSTLLLNADMQPLSFLPLSTVDWQEAIRYMVLDKATVLEWHNDWIVHSARWETRVPAVIMLRDYQKPKATIRLTKRNISYVMSILANTVAVKLQNRMPLWITYCHRVWVARPLGKIVPQPARPVTIARLPQPK